MIMEKLTQMKNKFFKFLPKQPVASMAFQNPTMSPSSSVTSRGSRSYKGPIIPKEARRKHRIGSFRTHEPSSPKVSCMGQVQCKKKRRAAKPKEQRYTAKESMMPPVSFPERGQEPISKRSDVQSNEKKGKVTLWIFKGSGGEGQKQSGNKGLVLEEKAQQSVHQVAPSLGSMKKFTSGRGSLSNFDVTER